MRGKVNIIFKNLVFDLEMQTDDWLSWCRRQNSIHITAVSFVIKWAFEWKYLKHQQCSEYRIILYIYRGKAVRRGTETPKARRWCSESLPRWRACRCRVCFSTSISGGSVEQHSQLRYVIAGLWWQLRSSLQNSSGWRCRCRQNVCGSALQDRYIHGKTREHDRRGFHHENTGNTREKGEG